MLFYITGGAPQAVPGTACVEAISTACIEDTCSSDKINIQGSKSRSAQIQPIGVKLGKDELVVVLHFR
jgi:hypothetical protein